MLKLILVPLDGSAFSEQALPTAQAIAKRENADLELVHVYEMIWPQLTESAPPLDPSLDLELRKRALERLEKIAETLRGSTGISVKATLLDGVPEDELATYIERRHVDLVVLSTHGHGGISRLWLGGIGSDLVERSFAPVLLIKPEAVGSPKTRTRSFSHVLIPLDGSRLGEEAIDHAIVVAGINDVQYQLLLVLPQADEVSDVPIAGLPNDEQLHEVAVSYLEGVAKNFRALGVNVDFRTVRHASKARAILDAADASGSDLIAMETHGGGGLKRRLIGGVADKVMRASKVPMLMHRPHVDEGARADNESVAAMTTGTRTSL
jgi:nucleotide-binding universal stress UspA family protein